MGNGLEMSCRLRRAAVAGVVIASCVGARQSVAQDLESQRVEVEMPVANDQLGRSVAVQGDTMAAGVRVFSGGPGEVVVFTRVDDVWQQQQRLTAPDNGGSDADEFGFAAAVQGDTLVVGAPARDEEYSPGLIGSSVGAAYVFTREAGVWTHSQTLIAPVLGGLDRGGAAVAIDGDTLAVGVMNASRNVDGNSIGGVAGVVDVYTRTAGTWTLQQRVFPTSPASISNFRLGFSVALQGDTLVSGAVFDATDGTNAGSAFVFTRSGDTWTEQAHLLAGAEAGEQDRFGDAVALDGDTVVVGARLDDDPVGGEDAGSAYVFVRDGMSWGMQQKLTAESPTADHEFGRAVAVAGDALFVGVPQPPSGGMVVPFTRSGDTWTRGDPLDAGVSDFAELGNRLALRDGTLLAAANDDSHLVPGPGVSAAGVVLAYDLAPLHAPVLALGPYTTGAEVGGTLSADGGTAPFTWDVVGGSSPFVGGGVPADGVLSIPAGTPGDYAFMLRVRDAAGRSAEGSLMVTVNDALVALEETSLVPYVPGRPYAFVFPFSGGTPPVVWATPGGAPVTGLELSQNGVLSGTVDPSDAASVVFDVRVSDGGGAEVVEPVTLAVAPLLQFPEGKAKSQKQTVLFGAAPEGVSSTGAALELVGGSLLSAVASHPKSQTPPLRIEVVDQRGVAVAIEDFVKASRRSLKLRNLPIPATGRYAVRIVGADGFEGVVKLRFSVKPPKKVSADGLVVPADGVPESISFSALPGALLAIVVKADKGEALLPTIVSVKDGVGNDLVVPGSLKTKGRKAAVKARVGENTEITVEVAGTDAAGGTAGWAVKAKGPRGYPVSLPELVSGSPGD